MIDEKTLMHGVFACGQTLYAFICLRVAKSVGLGFVTDENCVLVAGRQNRKLQRCVAAVNCQAVTKTSCR